MVVLQQQSSLLAGSGITGITSNSGIDLNIEPGTGTGVSQPRSSELDEFFINFE